MSGAMIFFAGCVVGIFIDSIIQVAMIKRKEKAHLADDKKTDAGGTADE